LFISKERRGEEGEGGTPMRIKEGDEVLDKEGAVFKIKRINKDMIILESSDDKRQIMTGISSLEDAYQKKEKHDG
jgi:hypothetical protein